MKKLCFLSQETSGHSNWMTFAMSYNLRPSGYEYAAEIEQRNLSALLSISSSELFLAKKADTAKTPTCW